MLDSPIYRISRFVIFLIFVLNDYLIPLQVKLYADYARPRLIDFLRASTEYDLEKVPFTFAAHSDG